MNLEKYINKSRLIYIETDSYKNKNMEKAILVFFKYLKNI